MSSTGENGQRNEEKDYRHTAVLVSIGRWVHFATFEGLASDRPAHCFDKPGNLPQGEALDTISASLA